MLETILSDIKKEEVSLVIVTVCVHDYFLFGVSGEARLDAILIHGVDEMSTKDIFAYFNDFAPGSVEWIDDSSCKCSMGCLIVLHCQL